LQEGVVEPVAARHALRPAQEQLAPFYAAGPVVALGPAREEEAEDQAEVREQEAAETAVPEPAPAVQGEGPQERATAYSDRSTIRLQGRTDADFSSSYRTRNVRVRSTTDCATCPDGKEIRITGMLVSTYRVQTRVTLPSVSDYPDLTPCQRQRVQAAIDDVLAPHEQAHVRAFRSYRGTTRRPFDLTVCRTEWENAVQSIFEGEEATRRDAAQAASDALDPFHFDVDLDCEDEGDE
jgi:hypothetical protein